LNGEFVKQTLLWYEKYGRDLPWRKTTDPYQILVSEMMLQQTQVSRVIPKYNTFLARFPTINSLAAASLGDVLEVWIGLGYNRRAKFLQQMAKVVVEKYDGALPQNYEQLLELPGLGPYTAGAVCAFAYNQPVIVIDANIKKIYNRVFGVEEKEIVALVAATVPKDRARDFYNALMDISSRYYSDREALVSSQTRVQTGDASTMSVYPYADFCKWYVGGARTIPSLKIVKQSKFHESNRWYRGQILRLLIAAKDKSITQAQFVALSPQKKYNAALSELIAEKIVDQKKPENLLTLVR